VREEAACLMDCLRAGSNAARCRRTFGTGSVVSSRQASRKYVLKNLQGAILIIIPTVQIMMTILVQKNAAYCSKTCKQRPLGTMIVAAAAIEML